MKRIALLALLLLSLALQPTGSLSAQSATRPATHTVSAERLARLDRLLQSYIDENRLPGIVTLVLHDGAPIYERAFGWSDKEAGRKMTVDTIFRIASQTKALTSAAILSLMEEGRLSVGDPVSRYIPSFAKTTVAVRSGGGVTFQPAKRAITIRDLLTHTAGISYGTSDDVAALYAGRGLGPAAGYGWYTADKSEPICTTMERLGTLPFVAQPGEAWVYGYNTDILGCVIEKASGTPLDQFIKARITGPLGMTDTQFFLAPAERNRLAAVYSSGDDGKTVRAPEGPRGQGAYVDGPRASFAGGAGLLSTARDYAKFLEAMRKGGGGILSPRAVSLMTTNQVGTLHSSDGLGFGFGFETTDRYGAAGMQSVGSFGWGGAYGSFYRVDPQAKLTVVVMIQQIPNRVDIRERVPNLIYQALLN
jgi:CubicO group peptidase (beta-lactamase class C family)